MKVKKLIKHSADNETFEIYKNETLMTKGYGFEENVQKFKNREIYFFHSSDRHSLIVNIK